jgi:dUTP pyrophosphatase
MDRIAQLVIVPIMQVKFRVVDEFSESERSSGGFGSSGAR